MAKDKKDKVNKLLLVEPNPDDNGIIPHEDLTISVNLTTTRKGRSVISIPATGVGKITNNNNGKKSTSIGFIDGTPIGKGKRALTTNYTEANSDLTVEGENDLESLGIESINIEFDTAYTPMIKIKFIDIRGQAIFQQEMNSKYKMFFELPYPIFDLTVKGFFGRPVKYCLHLLRWNSAFNSSTGNFEIDAEFIGYTYALLTDLLMGLIRAVVYTEEGQPIFNEYKEEWAKKGRKLTTIDDMLASIQQLGDEFEKLKQGDSNVRELKDSAETLEVLGLMEDKLSELSQSIIPDSQSYFRDSIGVLGTSTVQAESTTNRAAIASFKSQMITYSEKINKKAGGIVALKIDVDKVNKIKITTGITVDDLKNESTATTAIFNKTKVITTPDSYDAVSEVLNGSNTFGNVAKMMNIVIANIPTLPSTTEVVIYDLREIYNEISRLRKDIKDKNVNTRIEIGEKLRDIAKEKLNFDPTIYNIFSMLTVHCEVLLKTISKVSKAAENSTSRYGVLDKLTKNLNSKNTNKTIFAWPEYRKDIAKKGFQETWLGTDLLDGEALKVNEIVFTEHLLEELMNLVRRDDALTNLGNQGSSKPQFWPISTLDIPIKNDSLITQSPYTEALTGPNTKTTPQEATRCLLMRGFLGIGLNIAKSQKHNEAAVKIKGTLEADNLVKTLTDDIDTIFAKDIINQIKLLGDDGNGKFLADEAANNLLKEWEVGYETEVINPWISEGVNGLGVPLLKTLVRDNPQFDDNNYWEYIYIQSELNSRRTYIPISGNFDGRDFFYKNTPGQMKSTSKMASDELDKKTLYTGSLYNDDINLIKYLNEYQNDGAVYLKILSKNDYENAILTDPTYGQEAYQLYLTDNAAEPFIRQNNIKNPTYNYSDIGIGKLNIYGGRHKALEIGKLVYNGASGDASNDKKHYDIDPPNPPELGNVLCAYWSGNFNYPNIPHLQCGTYLANTEYREGGRFEYAREPFNPTIADWTLKNTPGGNNSGFDWILGNNSTYNRRREWHPNWITKQREELMGNILGDKRSSTSNETTLKETYIPFIEYSVSNSATKAEHHFSLFGSQFYYQQTTNEAKALLFLHCFPWQGCIGDIGDVNPGSVSDHIDVSMFDIWQNFLDNFDSYNGNEDDTYTIKSLYRNNSSFIKAPKLWCAFIGGLLYKRIKEPVLGGFAGGQQLYDVAPLIKFTGSRKEFAWGDGASKLPSHGDMLYETRSQSRAGINFMFDSGDPSRQDSTNKYYSRIETTLTGFPQQVKDEFINVFKEFVNGDFLTVQSNFEIANSTGTLKSAWTTLTSLQKSSEELNALTGAEKFNGKTAALRGKNYNEKYNGDPNFRYLKTSPGFSNAYATSNAGKDWTKVDDVLNTFPLYNTAVENYDWVTACSNWPWSAENGGNGNKINQIGLKIKANSPGSMLLNNLMGEFVYINNAIPRVFNSQIRTSVSKPYDSDTNFSSNGYERITIRKTDMKIYLETFFARFDKLTTDTILNRANEEDEIQNRLFNTIDDDIIKLNIYRTIGSIHNKWVAGTDNPFSNCGFTNSYDKKVAENKRGSSNAHLIDSFRFLDRAYNDIGDDFIINPLAISSMLVGNYNQSFFDVANKILIDNNFNFIALPTFVNFKDEEELANIFKPYSYSDVDTASGPSFVCVYAGQTSKHLDLGVDSDYDDDGIVINTDEYGKYSSGAPADFVRAESNDGSLNIPYFFVSYGQQNQSFFKDIKLDQREFAETMESLQIIEDISQSGDKRKPNTGGQNLFNVYQTRSYSAEIEMMGNALIQPMMYFQLNNIPMFRGAYMIIKTSHNITAHNMTTKFTGVRIKDTKTPLVEASTIFMNILGSLESLNGPTTDGPPYYIGPMSMEENPGGVIITTLGGNGFDAING